jgi:hypothetical protein
VLVKQTGGQAQQEDELIKDGRCDNERGEAVRGNGNDKDQHGADAGLSLPAENENGNEAAP